MQLFLRTAWLAALVLFASLAQVRSQPNETGKVPPELTWIPPDCTGFVHVKFSALWSSNAGLDIRKSIQTLDDKALSEIEKQIGLPLSQIESVTVVLPAFGPGHEPGLAIRINSVAAFNKANVLTALGAEALNDDDEKAPAAGATIYRTRQGGALHLSNDRFFTIFPDREAALLLLGKMLNRRESGPLSDALRLASGDSQIIAALNVMQLPEIPADELPPEISDLRETRFVVVQGRLTDDTGKLQARLTFSSPGKAGVGTKAVEGGRKLMLAEIEQSLQEFLQNPKENHVQIVLLQELVKVIRTATVQSDGSVVRVEAEAAVTAAFAKAAANGADALRLTAQRNVSQNNLKQIGIAMHNYHDVHGTLPPAAICDSTGKPLLSWRVAILPYIEQEALYKRFRLDEAWDSEHNKKLINEMPKQYLLPGINIKQEFPSTHYQVLVGNSAMFELRKGVSFARITDGLSNTFMVVEADTAVPWSKPDDLAYDPKQAPKLGYHYRSSCNALFGDGSVRSVKKTTKPEILHLYIQRDDGQVVPNLP